jgi:DeoR family glycerol-3-phosphate regulon repressor
MSQTLRHPEILEILRRDGKVTVEQLADHFQVTLQTVRRDLTELAESRQIERVHGGAILPARISNIRYEERKTINHTGKSAIAERCARDIPDDISLFLNIGTSTEAVARALLNHKNLMVVTNNMNVAAILAANPNCEIIVTGGHLRRSDNGLIGNPAIETIEKFKFDLAVIGCSALDHDGDMLDYDMQEIGVSQAILAQSRQTYVVADHTKFTRSAPVKIASLRDVDRFYTDTALPNTLTQLCAENGTQVISLGHPTVKHAD